MIAPALPASLAPPAPFPLVLAQSQINEDVAPGMRRGTYRLQTADGPLVIEVVAIDPNESTVRFGAVLANDRLVSPGETVSSMARRTGAVAGVNADYFDIGQTNQPLNVVVRDGALVRTPSKRIALDVRRDRSIHFENFTFSGSVQNGTTTFPLTGINEWPPQGGAAFVTSAYGALHATPNVTVATLVPADVTHRGDRIDGSYRVAALDDPSATNAGLALGFGPAALALGPPPKAGDDVTVSTSVTPALDDVTVAVGGGPLLVAHGTVAFDPNAPAPEERDVHFPVSGAFVTATGTLVLVSVDGRQPALSIGVTRPQFAALMLGFGASDGMAFDSGGSATLVARELGDASASLLNAPSDGAERPVADGFFAYSDAPVGAPNALAVRPSSVVTLPNVDVPVRVTVIDRAGHALGVAHPSGGDVVRGVSRSTVVPLHANGLTARVPVRVVDRLAHLTIASDVRPDPGALVRFTAVGSDVANVPVALGSRVRWSATRGAFIAPGVYRAGSRDARVVATAGETTAAFDVRVGRHRVVLPIFDAMHAAAWRFASAPANLAGAVAVDNVRAQLQLTYDFTTGARAAYADASLPLPGEPDEFDVDVDGDGSGIGLRAAFVNRFGERRALTLAKSVDWKGWETRTIVLPNDLNPPVRLAALYAVPSLGGVTPGSRSRGTLNFRNPSVVAAGTP